MSECQAELLESSDPDRSRWWCPKCGPNIGGPCSETKGRKMKPVHSAIIDLLRHRSGRVEDFEADMRRGPGKAAPLRGRK